MDVIEKQVRIYRIDGKRESFTDWLHGLKDRRGRQKIQARLARLRLGNLGHSNPIGEGVLELKINFGPGYRVYFGQDGPTIVILLCGGDKGTQSADIKKAKVYWADYQKKRGHEIR